MSVHRGSLAAGGRGAGRVGTNKRYADAMDRRAAELSQQTLTRIPHKSAERLPAVAHGWNDRVVVVYWMSDAGELNTVVWRNAVTQRKLDECPS